MELWLIAIFLVIALALQFANAVPNATVERSGICASNWRKRMLRNRADLQRRHRNVIEEWDNIKNRQRAQQNLIRRKQDEEAERKRRKTTAELLEWDLQMERARADWEYQKEVEAQEMEADRKRQRAEKERSRKRLMDIEENLRRIREDGLKQWEETQSKQRQTIIQNLEFENEDLERKFMLITQRCTGNSGGSPKSEEEIEYRNSPFNQLDAEVHGGFAELLDLSANDEESVDLE